MCGPALARPSERQGRLIDHDEQGSMEQKKWEGYFRPSVRESVPAPLLLIQSTRSSCRKLQEESRSRGTTVLIASTVGIAGIPTGSQSNLAGSRLMAAEVRKCCRRDTSSIRVSFPILGSEVYCVP
ncbi:MAG: hypothetical protein C0483_00100 [Pirellula sp.]|nr:hypothetical protein [Pirellula sp.]